MNELEMLLKIKHKVKQIDEILNSGNIIVSGDSRSYIPKREDITAFLISERELLVKQYNTLIKSLPEIK